MRFFKIFAIFAALALSFQGISQAPLNPYQITNLPAKKTWSSKGRADSATTVVVDGRNAFKVTLGDWLGYKEWTGLLTQTSTTDPTATVLHNSLGGTIVWTRTSAGLYGGKLTGAFTNADKVVLYGNAAGDGTAVPVILAPARINADSITLRVSSAGTLTDAKLTKTPFTIRVYK